MSSTIGTTGDPIVRVHRAVGEGARSAAAGLPVVNSAGLRSGERGANFKRLPDGVRAA